MKNKTKKFISTGLVSENRKARFNYSITETYEAGIVLTGSEVKSLRLGQVNIIDGYATPSGNEVILNNITIGKYDNKDLFTVHTEKRPRKLLLNKTEIKKIIGFYNTKHITIVPLKIYFNNKGLAKVLLGIGMGKNTQDKRETIKQRDWNREKSRIMKIK